LTAAALPYRTATWDSMKLGAWHFRGADGMFVRLETAIGGWDYDLDLALTRTFQLDAARLRDECGLSHDAVLQVCVVVSSQSARYRSCVWRSRAMAEQAADGTIEFVVSGTMLAETISLTTEVVLLASDKIADPFVAHLPGSRLLSDEVTTQLEGTGSRFPVESVDFDVSLSYLRAPHALWYLSWSRGDLAAPAMRDVRLYLNSRHKALLAAATNGDAHLVAMLSVDVARQLIAGALDSDEFMLDPASFPDGSTGDVARRLIQACFPHRTLREIQSMRAASPAKFEALVQSGAGAADVEW